MLRINLVILLVFHYKFPRIGTSREQFLPLLHPTCISEPRRRYFRVNYCFFKMGRDLCGFSCPATNGYINANGGHWDESALGAFGESITYDPAVSLNRAMVDDVRPFLVEAGKANGDMSRASGVGLEMWDMLTSFGIQSFLSDPGFPDHHLFNPGA